MSTPSIDKHLAILLAQICKQTYVHHRNDESVLPDGYELVAALQGTPFSGQPSELIGLIAQSAHGIIIAFRGSKTILEWFSDFRYRQVAWPYASGSGSVHCGFLSIYDSCREQILAALSTLPTTAPLIITGHSLGGALATFCALDLAQNTACTQPVLYTYGSPRVGSWWFARTHQKLVPHHQRIVVTADIVPTQPPVLLLSNPPLQIALYSHIGSEVPLQVEGGGTIKHNHDLDTYVEELSKLPEA